MADTRFVYDSRGDLRYVISPEGMQLISEGAIDSDILHQFANCYTYDLWHRIIEKRLAGCEPIEYVYDRLNRPFMSRNGEQKSKGEWRMTKYDRKNRPVLEGIVSSRSDRASFQALYGDSIITEHFVLDWNQVEQEFFYTAESGPDNFEPYRAWYYDDYKFTDGYTFNTIPEFPNDPELPATGMCTGMADKVNGCMVYRNPL